MLAAEDLSRVVAKAKGKRPLSGKSKAKGRSAQECSEVDDDSSEPESEEVKKCKDDGDLKYYEQRLAEYYANRSKSAKDFTFDGGLKVPGDMWKMLYKYQKTGVKWLWELHCQQVGGILGDEMGLGKTIQIICFLAALHYSQLIDKAPPRYRGLGPTIIVTPVTVMHQWVKEFHTWYPPIRVAVLHSTGSSGGSASSLLHSIAASNGVIITSFSTFLLQQDHILKHQWQYIILDEGHKIRNPDAQVTVAVKLLKTVHRLILSGSPIQNNLKELWSLFDFVFPGRLGMLVDFMEHFAVPITQGGYANASQTQVLTAYKCACVLRETISPYLIRRMKADVNQKQLKLPDKREHVLFCQLTREQREVYREYLGSSEVENILSGRLLIFPGLIKMRKICNHPDLTTGELRTKYSQGKITDKDREYGYYKRSGKMIVCKSLLKMWQKQRRQVLLFTQSTQMLDILESFVQKEGYTYLRMDGTTAVGSRQVLVNKFNQDKSVFVFLLTTRVGGLGVNLVAASRIVIFDPDWNPSTDMQARERAWRIGQQRDVIIYRLVCTGSIEEKIYQRQIFKQFLTNKILSNPKQRRFFRSGDLKDLFSLAEVNQEESNSETQAIFAGTGSKIDFKKIQAKAEQAKREARQRAKEREAEEKSRKDRMWEMARMLSHKIESDNHKQDPDQPATEGTVTGEQSHGNTTPAGDDNTENKQAGDSDITERESKVITTALASETRNIINSDLFGNLGDLEFESKVDDKVEADEDLFPTAKPKNLGAKCEGKVIPGLAKVRKFKQAKNGSSDVPEGLGNSSGRSTEIDDEEYILNKLLKKSLLNGAMKHDTIVDACNADYAIIEAEADKVAKQAAEHLRRAKKRMRDYSSADYNNGPSPSKKQRFGNKTLHGDSPQKSTVNVATPKISKKASKSKSSPKGLKEKVNTKSTDSPKPTTSTQANGTEEVKVKNESSVKVKRIKFVTDEVFNGKKLTLGSEERTYTDSDKPLPSSVLLEAMRRRSGVPDGLCDSKHALLTENIREFIASKRNTVDLRDYVTTQEILDEFSADTDVSPPTFRAILRELCHFHKVNDIGRWILKDEFS